MIPWLKPPEGFHGELQSSSPGEASLVQTAAQSGGEWRKWWRLQPTSGNLT